MKWKNELQRVLIVNASAIGESSGTGVTLGNLWCDYPKENILQIRIDCHENIFDEDYHTISTPVEFCAVPNKISIRRSVKRKTNITNTVLMSNTCIAQKGVKASVNDAIRGIFDSWPLKFSCLNERIDSFKPEVIYTCGASIRILKTALYYSKRYDIPIVLHLMDDWPGTIYTTSWASTIFRGMVLSKLKQVAQRSHRSFAISEALAKKYEQMLGVEMLPLMNPAADIATDINTHDEGVVRFVYAGSLGINRWKSLLDIAKYLQDEKGGESQFDLYVPKRFLMDEMVAAFESYHAHLHAYVDRDELGKIYKRSDVMVYAESFDVNVAEFTKYSLSTKIPEYMGTGNAMLAYLPKSAHANDYIRDREVGFVANTKEELAQVLHVILTDEQSRQEMAKRALEIDRNEHSAEVEKKKLYAALGYNVVRGS